MKSAPLFEGSCLSIHTITPSATEFMKDLDKRELRDFRVAATVLDNSIRRGRSPGGRSERVEGSKAGLWEMRITPPGRKGPHTRALYLRQGSALLIVRGLRKAERGIPRREIQLADKYAHAFRRRNDEHPGRRNVRGSP